MGAGTQSVVAVEVVVVAAVAVAVVVVVVQVEVQEVEVPAVGLATRPPVPLAPVGIRPWQVWTPVLWRTTVTGQERCHPWQSQLSGTPWWQELEQ